MSRIRTSPIWLIPLQELKDLVAKSSTMTEALLSFGLINKGGNFKTLKARLIEDSIDYSHFLQGAKKASASKSAPIETFLISNSTSNRYHFKARLLKEGILENVCAVCGQLPEWNDKPLSLQLDHINGISNDNRLENLRIICPHCHSQTDNFAGRNKKYTVDGIEYQSGKSTKPKKIIIRGSRKDPRPNIRKVIRPSKEELQELILKKPISKLAKDFGVSDSAIHKWIKNYGLQKLPAGYWNNKTY
jgi:hypothetical protein